ncbi:MAG: flagellar brake protein [Betaproteobacteria bacterium]|nr:flagellar brake protein [Betaproteobacteria bacterium]
MGLMPVTQEEISIGVPMPWAIYDQNHTLLVAQGEIIRSQEQAETLLTQGAFRKLSWENAAENMGTAAIEELAPAQPLEAGKETKSHTATFSFEDIKLRVGDRLQIQPPSNLSQDRFLVKLIGYVPGATLLITTPVGDNGLRLALMEGETIVVRSFSGQNVFGFSATIERVCKIPFDYLHLSYPAEVRGIVIRKSHRVKTNIIATVQNVSPDAPQEPMSGLISNLSADGAAVDARRELGKKGSELTLVFRITLHNVEAYLKIKVLVRAVLEHETNAELIRHGVEFLNIQPNDNVILQSMIYQQMIENPHNLA